MPIVVVLMLIVSSATRAQRPVEELRWIAGCWQGVGRGGTHIDEQWMAPRAGTMLGMSRTVRGDTVVTEFEHLQILERNGRAVYHAEPSGQPPADFVASALSDTLVVFENPTHDFPQRIIYHRRGRDSVIARIEGTMNGQSRGVDFPYVRASCAQ